MDTSDTIDLKAAALKFRENQNKSTSISSDDHDETLDLDDEFDSSMDEEPEAPLPEEEPASAENQESSEPVQQSLPIEEPVQPPPDSPTPAKNDYIYTSKDVKVTLSYIEIDNFTYAMSSIGWIKRLEVKPSMHECWISLGFVTIATVTLFTYLLIGVMGLGVISLSLLSVILIVLLLLSELCQTLKSNFTLELYSFEGKLIDKVCVLSKKSIDSLEKAIKQAMHNVV